MDKTIDEANTEIMALRDKLAGRYNLPVLEIHC